ncbi:hypothetical protein [Streptomyces odontomachi]|uniref:hypothetical protein n=1 Tax=Streptomyces odontomachi TaxID=2944940 RepID=UPI002108712D|nr:hypothetical protein [Streptomyces sp. ODS25]
MTVDPTDPDTIDIENRTDIPENEANEQLGEVSVEAPEADTAEQRADLAPRHDDLQAADPDNANEADLAEQARIVELDEDDYR